MRHLLIALTAIAIPSAAGAQTVFFGNLHAHSSYSDGRGTPDQAFAAARAAGLDFMAVTEHNHHEGDGKADARDGVMIATRPELYSGAAPSLRAAADAATVNGTFVAIAGQEFSTISKGNHVNVFDVPDVLRSANGDFLSLASEVRAVRDSGGGLPLIQFNHPRNEGRFPADYGRDDYGGDDRRWIADLDPLVELIEVLNAPALRDGTGMRPHRRETEYLRYLNLGFHIAPSVGHDNHHRNWGAASEARIAVLAAGLTRADILNGLRRRHAYATEDRNLRIVFRANGALSGDIVPPPPPGSELRLTVSLVDPDEPDAVYRVDVFQDAPGGRHATAPVESFEVRGNSPQPILLEGVTHNASGEFVLLRVTQFSNDEHEEEDRAWTAPVWFEAGAIPNAPSAALLRIASLVPNPGGDERLEERVTIRNDGSVAVDLTGWRLRDAAGNTWLLDGARSLTPGQQREVIRGGQAMSLNNGGDVVELLDPSGTAVDTVSYGPAGENTVVPPRRP